MSIPVEDRKYVLRSTHFGGFYYTGKQPTHKLHKAKIFKLKYAKSAKQFVLNSQEYEIRRVTDKMLFKAALEGK